MSLNSNPNDIYIINHGGAFRVKSIPKGLKIILMNGTHYELIPFSTTDIARYQKLLYLVKLVGGR